MRRALPGSGSRCGNTYEHNWFLDKTSVKYSDIVGSLTAFCFIGMQYCPFFHYKMMLSNSYLWYFNQTFCRDCYSVDIVPGIRFKVGFDYMWYLIDGWKIWRRVHPHKVYIWYIMTYIIYIMKYIFKMIMKDSLRNIAYWHITDICMLYHKSYFKDTHTVVWIYNHSPSL